MFAGKQEGVRECIYRVFGVLLNCFGILDQPARLWMSEEISDVIRACCIINNMVFEERNDYFIVDGVGGLGVDRIGREVPDRFSTITIEEMDYISSSLHDAPSQVYEDP